jgi:hypothetical protein
MAAQEREVMTLALAEEWDALEAQLTEIYMAQLRSAAPSGDVDEAALAEMVQEVVDQSMAQYRSPRYLFNAGYDPAADWSRVTAPVLALFAEHDYNVAADLNGPALADALEAAGNEDVAIATVPGVNHLFLAANDADPANWTAEATDLEPVVLDEISDWLLARVTLADSDS